MEIIHGSNEYGIDLYIDLEKGERIKFALQVKSHSDISKSSFIESIHAQIEKSIRHGLERLVFAFAADLTKQERKINNALGEIHTRNTVKDYIIVLNAPELYTMYNVYLKKLHPVDFLNINTSNVMELANKFSKLLSNNKRMAKVSISLEYNNRTNNDEGFHVFLRSNEDNNDTNLVDRL